ncbi:MAG: RND transporter, partial [Xanthomonadales bacterium]|nr:RND transporter [Xanthomonadales bacterium]
MTNPVEKFASTCIERRTHVLIALVLVTLVLGIFAFRIDVRTIFEDMLPHNHPWVETHDDYKEYFGGANLVTIMVSVEEGNIFRTEVLAMVREITRGLRMVSGVNHLQITSLASRKVKGIRATHYEIDTSPLMWPDVPQTRAELDRLREDVLKNPLVLGQYVSTDLKSTVITADFIDHLVQPDVVFRDIRQLIEETRIPGVEVDLVGEPILNG